MSRATSKELFLTLNGVDHWVRKIGNCNRDVPPLLIIHGGPGGNNYVFERTIGPFLENFWPVIYYEQRGCGRSAAPENKEAYSKEILVTDILELCQKLSLRRIIPLGYSFGAELTMELALHAPHLISKMILQSPSIDDQERIGLVQVCGFEQLAEGQLLDDIIKLKNSQGSYSEKCDRLWKLVGGSQLVDQFLFVDSKKAKLNRKLWKESGLKNTGHMAEALAKETTSESILHRIDAIQAPTLILGGFHDRNIGVDVFRDIAAKIPNSTLHLFFKSAHFPDIEEPEKYAESVKRFLLTG